MEAWGIPIGWAPRIGMGELILGRNEIRLLGRHIGGRS